MVVPIILSGGAGSRLWPLSREHLPKQLLRMLGGNLSLFQMTIKRLSAISAVAPPIIICNESHRFLIAAQMQEIGVAPAAIILEPAGRNTSPAAAVASFEVSRVGADPVMLVLPADHVIRDEARFAHAVDIGKRVAREGSIVTFGIVPDRPETGYGYIKRGEPLDGFQAEGLNASFDSGAYRVFEFAEKPDIEKACRYVESRAYLWNSGMFMFRPSIYLKELDRFSADTVESCRRAHEKARCDLDFIRLDEQSFLACPSDSIDYAVLEKTSLAAVIPLEAGWSDVGSWLSLHAARNKDEKGNVTHGDVLVEGVSNCYIHSDGRLVAAVGIENQVVIETKDAVLVSTIDRAQEVKAIVARLKEAGREEALAHSRTYRPWGSYECVDCSERFQVKRISVNPGARLSLQMHHHRAEHWIVVRGTARITRGEEVLLLSEDQSTYIPWGTRHRLENPGKIPLEVIEVQTGSYLGEDDIVRFEDEYGRFSQEENVSYLPAR